MVGRIDMGNDTVRKVNENIERIRNGDEEAVKGLYSLMGLHLRYIAIKYFGDAPLADDILQRFWLHIEYYCQKFRFDGNGFNYLARIFENSCRAEYRRHRREREYRVSIDTVKNIEAGLSTDPEATVQRAALCEAIDNARAQLSPDERLVFDLILYGELSVRDIARLTDRPKTTVGRLRQAAFERVKAILSKNGWDGTEF